jgi:hypothetical protein
MQSIYWGKTSFDQTSYKMCQEMRDLRLSVDIELDVFHPKVFVK